MGETTTFRHGNGKFGVLSYLEFVLLLAGLVMLIKNRDRRAWMILALALGLLPAVISNDVPHSNRAHGILPWVELVAAYGFMQCEVWISQYKSKHKTAWITHNAFYRVIVVVLVLQTILYVTWYAKVYTTTPAVQDFQYGYQEAVMYARQHEGQVDKVLFTNGYGQAYIFILLFKHLTPIQFHQGGLANYEIRDLNWQQDSQRTNILIVGTPKEIPATALNIVKEISYPGGGVAFRIVQQ
jgi:hypothetical protein